ncbi:MAP kinase kinase (MEK) [Chytridiales sp. JEL 0842]|nr:MAP kinase kinase (MEK) [Chytridiales sp. JEL 0842]
MSATSSPKPKVKKGPSLKLNPINSNRGAGLESPSATGPLLTQKDLSLPPQFSDIKPGDIEVLSELGAGNGGTVNKIEHKPSKTLMARKIIHVEANKTIQKQILRELQILKSCSSPYIVSFYGAFLDQSNISICMEYMDLGSLDWIYKKMGTLEEDIISQITISVLKGLVYLFEEHKIIHRDVKPSNILLNSAGQIKIADFGVSGELTNSMVKTFVGTSAYMSPERIKGLRYSVQCDVWSLGITLIELAVGRFPFPADGKPLTLFELLECIVEEPLPTLPEGKFSKLFNEFIVHCLVKDDAKRPKPADLLSDPFCVAAEKSNMDVKGWAERAYKKLRSGEDMLAQISRSIEELGLEAK